MKKFLFLTIFTIFSLSLYAKESLIIDATDDKTLLNTFSAISMKLPPDERQDFSNASAIIMFYGSTMGFSEEKMRSLFNEKTAQGLIDLAQSYCPATRDESYTLKSKNKEEFSRSFIIMLMNLPIESQRKFSHIIAQIMVVAKLNKLDEESLLKELDGLTAKEIIKNFDSVKDSAKATKE